MLQPYWKICKIATVARKVANRRRPAYLSLETILAIAAILRTFQYATVLSKRYTGSVRKNASNFQSPIYIYLVAGKVWNFQKYLISLFLMLCESFTYTTAFYSSFTAVLTNWAILHLFIECENWRQNLTLKVIKLSRYNNYSSMIE